MAIAQFIFKVGIILIILGVFAQIVGGLTGVIPTISIFPNIMGFYNTYIYPVVGWFTSILPPTFRILLGTWLGFLILSYTFTTGYHIIMKVYHWVEWGKKKFF